MSSEETPTQPGLKGLTRQELPVAVGLFTTAIFWTVGRPWIETLQSITEALALHAALRLLSMLPVVLLSKKMAHVIDFGIERVGAPQALSGLIVAQLVLAPEALAACKAALANKLQRMVNIALGSALATIGLTVPAVLVVSEVTHKTIELGFETSDIVLLSVTCLTASVSFGGRRTNTLAGAVHLVLFFAYAVLVFD